MISRVNALEAPVAFLLWGSYAQKKAAFVDDVTKGGRHLVLKAPHPSPLSAHNGFFGCRHFSKANDFLAANGAARSTGRCRRPPERGPPGHLHARNRGPFPLRRRIRPG